MPYPEILFVDIPLSQGLRYTARITLQCVVTQIYIYVQWLRGQVIRLYVKLSVTNMATTKFIVLIFLKNGNKYFLFWGFLRSSCIFRYVHVSSLYKNVHYQLHTSPYVAPLSLTTQFQEWKGVLHFGVQICFRMPSMRFCLLRWLDTDAQ